MTWVLVIYIYAGMWAKGDSVTLTTVSGFTSLASCEAAGKQSEVLVKDSAKTARFMCVEVK
jgi:hypothetical protein